MYGSEMRRGRGGVLACVAATVLLTLAATLLTPANAAAAGTFQWKADTSGNRNDVHPPGESVGDGSGSESQYLREDGGAPIVKTYSVPATSRFNVDVRAMVPELTADTSFGAVIEVTNDVPIAVERSFYWNALGALWAGGSHAPGMPLPVK